MARMSSRRKERSFVKAWDGSCFKLQLNVLDSTLTANGATPKEHRWMLADFRLLPNHFCAVAQSTCTLLRNSNFNQLYLGAVDEKKNSVGSIFCNIIICFYSALSTANGCKWHILT